MRTKATGIFDSVRIARLKKILDEEQITQEQLVLKIGCTQQTISRIMNGKQVLTEHTAHDICNIYTNYTAGWLLGYVDNGEKESSIQKAICMIIEQLPKDIEVLKEIINDEKSSAKDRICAIKALNVAETKLSKYYRR